VLADSLGGRPLAVIEAPKTLVNTNVSDRSGSTTSTIAANHKAGRQLAEGDVDIFRPYPECDLVATEGWLSYPNRVAFRKRKNTFQ
jgi:hypothetical protein